ncbi:molybdopterin-dependent oxidoreductase [Candidatus Zixiibacteriota bacterium]
MRSAVSTPSPATPSSSGPSERLLMSQRSKSVRIKMDNRDLRVRRGLTVLQAAEEKGIYIPTLCAHKDLTPYGGCRLCIVEVEGMRGLPTACTTPVEDGMIIRTHTAQVQDERREILQLLLSEHTSSCLICDQQEECRDYMGTIRKAGVTTGCRYCPNDDGCELQDVVEHLELREIGYPIYYRNLRVEKEDPFYDRDYNLCILCGRCIRMCQEIRTANVLAFKQRGRHTVIGPAFHRTHMDSGCEFCGACVSACPTGALAEKARKWEGPPDRERISTCSLCGVGCQVRLLTKGNRVIGSLPSEDGPVNRGQLCVKGRFCTTELVNGRQRLKQPYTIRAGTRVQLSWEEAIDLAAGKLSDCRPEQFGMVISPDCTNEDLYVAQKFVRLAMGSNNIDTSARVFYGPSFNAYLSLMKRAVPLSNLESASAILCVGLDTRFGRSVVGVALRRAQRDGVQIVSIHAGDHNLSLIADRWLRPEPGGELKMLRALLKLVGKGAAGQAGIKSTRKTTASQRELQCAAEMLAEAKAPVILIGPDLLGDRNSRQTLEVIEKLAGSIEAGILTLPTQANLYGSVLMGTYPELLPGGFSFTDKERAAELRRIWLAALPKMSTAWNTGRLRSSRKLKVLYLVGEMIPGAGQLADFVIHQNIYPPKENDGADLVLPGTAYTEVDGTLVNGEGRVQRIRKAVPPPGKALPDWKILCRIAGRMNKKGFAFSSAGQVYRELSGMIPGMGTFARPAARPLSLSVPEKVTDVRYKSAPGKIPGRGRSFQLYASGLEHTYRGLPLAGLVSSSQRVWLTSIRRMRINLI